MTKKPGICRMFDIQSVSEVSQLVAKGVTESEAATLIGRTPAAWFSWKARRGNDEKFKEALERARATRINGLIQTIEKSATGEGMKQRDWRAADRLLAYVAPERFKDHYEAPNTTVQLSVFAQAGVDISAMWDRTAEREAKSQGKLPPGTGSPRLLPAPTDDPETPA